VYFQLRQTPVLEGLYMTNPPQLGWNITWISGSKHPKRLAEPIEVELNDEYGTEMADIFDDNILLMSAALVDGLKDAGVDNFDSYDVELIDKKRSQSFEGYKAIQVIGRIAAADMSASDSFDPTGAGHTLVQFRELHLDEGAIKDALMFRLHESVSTLIVHQQVADKLRNLDLRFVSLVPVGEHPVPKLDEQDEETE